MREIKSRATIVAITAATSAAALLLVIGAANVIDYLNRTSDLFPIGNNFLLLSGAFLTLSFLFLAPFGALIVLKRMGWIRIPNPENAAGGAALAFSLTSQLPEVIFQREFASAVTSATWQASPAYFTTSTVIELAAWLLGGWLALALLKKNRALVMIAAAILLFIPISMLVSR